MKLTQEEFLKLSDSQKAHFLAEIAKGQAKITKINIEDYIPSTHFITKKELIEKTGLTDRSVRHLVSDLKTKRVVLYTSQRSGYRLAKEIRSMSEIELEEEINLVQHSLNDCKSRVKQFKKQMRKYIAYLKKAEQIKLEQENDNHTPHID